MCWPSESLTKTLNQVSFVQSVCTIVWSGHQPRELSMWGTWMRLATEHPDIMTGYGDRLYHRLSYRLFSSGPSFALSTCWWPYSSLITQLRICHVDPYCAHLAGILWVRSIQRIMHDIGGAYYFLGATKQQANFCGGTICGGGWLLAEAIRGGGF